MILARRMLWLAELTVYDVRSAGTTVLRVATGRGFTTEPGDTPSNAYYEPRLMQAVDIVRSMYAPGATTGRSTVAPGDLVVANPDGGLDAWLEYAFDGRDVRILWGYEGDAYSAFTTVFVGTMDFPDFSQGSIVIKLRDRQRELDAPLQLLRYDGSNALPAGLEGVAGDLKGKVKPLLYGTAKNFAPPMVNSSLLAHQISSEAVDDCSAVYDQGAPLTREVNYADMAEYLATSPSAGCYRYLSSATYSGFRLGSSPVGAVTCDAGALSTAFPATSDIDTFTQADGAVDPADWTNDPLGLGNPLTVESNALKGPTGSNGSIGTIATGGPDFECYAELSVVLSPTYTGSLSLAFVNGSVNGYALTFSPHNGALVVARSDAGVSTTLASATVALADGDAIGLRRLGDVCESWARVSGVWSRQSQVVDTTHHLVVSLVIAWYGLGATRVALVGGGNVSPIAFPATFVLDDFDRADSALQSDARWGSGGTTDLSVESNDLVPTDGSTNAATYLTEHGPDFEYWAEFTDTGTGLAADLRFYWQLNDASSNGYMLEYQVWLGSPTFLLHRIDAGVLTTLVARTGMSIVDGDAIGWRRFGNLLQVYERVSGVWSQVGDDVLDSTYTTLPGNLLVASLSGAFANIRIASLGGGTLFDYFTHADLFQAVIDRANANRSDPTLFVMNPGDIAAYAAADPGEIGVFINDELKLTEALDLAANRGDAWWSANAMGLFRVQQLDAATGTPLVQLTDNDIIPPFERLSTRDEDRGVPLYRQTIKYARNYTPQTSDLAGVVTDARRAELAQAWREATFADAVVQNEHLLAGEATKDSLYVHEADAYNTARRQQRLRSVQRHRFEALIPMRSDTALLDLGDVIALDHPRFGLSVIGGTTGQLFRILGIAPDARNERLRLTLWGNKLSTANLLTEASEEYLTEAGEYLLTE